MGVISQSYQNMYVNHGTGTCSTALIPRPDVIINYDKHANFASKQRRTNVITSLRRCF